jgi:SsrA-binding protein
MSIATNKKAYHDFEMLEEFEAGIVLTGTEVKSVRKGYVNLKDSYVRVSDGELFLVHTHISVYENGNINNHDPLRIRKLLLHKREINRLQGKVKEEGLALVPIKIYIKGHRIKLSMALAKGKKLYDKRRTMRDKEMKKDIERAFKSSNR